MSERAAVGAHVTSVAAYYESVPVHGKRLKPMGAGMCGCVGVWVCACERAHTPVDGCVLVPLRGRQVLHVAAEFRVELPHLAVFLGPLSCVSDFFFPNFISIQPIFFNLLVVKA